jgi:hypothetical protein
MKKSIFVLLLKRVLSLTLIICLTITPAPMATGNIDTASSWARDGLTAAIAKGFVPSNLQNNYQNTITRAEFCRLAVSWVEYRTGKSIDEVMAERGVSRNPNAFTDTNDPNIIAAFALEITSGIGNNQFNPNGNFTREQAAGMILNVGKVVGMDTSNSPPSGFADMDEVSPWCVEGVNFCFVNEIMQGSDNRFNPKGLYTREQSILTFNNIKVDVSSPTLNPNPTPTPSRTLDIVYWTPNGTAYHSTSGCRSLARSRDIRSGTISQAGRRSPCRNCVR